MSGATTKPLAELRGVSFRYPGSVESALDGIDLSLQAGELVLILGESGAGKTTLARCLNRAIPSYQRGDLSGSLWLAGEDRSTASVADLAGVVGLVTQDFDAQLFSTNVLLEVAFGLEQLGVSRDEMKGRVLESLAMVGLEGFDRRDPSTLSGGEKQRLSIAAVVAMHPGLLVFDEPTTDLDPLGKREIFELLGRLRDGGMGVVLIEHEIEASAVADRVVLMREGRIVEDGEPDRVLRNTEWLVELGLPVADLDAIAVAIGYDGRLGSVAEAAQQISRARGPLKRVENDERRPGETLVEVRDVTFAYPDGPTVLHGISLDVRIGEIVALVGPNGSGKTTFSKHLNGLLSPSGGSVHVAGRNLRELDLEDVASVLAYVFQNPDHQIFASSVRDEVRFAVDNLGLEEAEVAERCAEAIAAVGLQGLEDADPFLLGKGHRQRLAVASLLVLRPRLLILDEPTTGLDVGEQREMMTLLSGLREAGAGVLVITHTPWVVAEWSDRCIALESGNVLFDGPTGKFLAAADIMERCDFEPPTATQVGAALGVTVRSVGELIASLAAPSGQ